MFHKAKSLEFKEGTVLELSFRNGEIRRYDISALYDRYPQMKALENRELFLSGKLAGGYGIIWNDDLDLEVETVYEDGEDFGHVSEMSNAIVADAVTKARLSKGLTQADLSAASGISQSDISKLERGVYNPSVKLLQKIADALEMELKITIE